MNSGSLDGKEDGEYNDVGFVEISKHYAMQDEISFGAAPVYTSFFNVILLHLLTGVGL